MAEFYAQPYDSSASGFYFDSVESYEEKVAKSRVEEFEIQLIDGDDDEVAFFKDVTPQQYNILRLIEFVDQADEDELRAVAYLVSDRGESLEDAIDKAGDVRMYEGSVKDYAYDLVEDIGAEGLSEDYFDYESFGRDLSIGGDETRHLYDDLESAKEELDEAADEDEVKEVQGRIEEIQEQIGYIESMSDQELGEYVVEQYGDVSSLSDETRKMYFDYDALARDMELSSDVDTFWFAGSEYVITNPHDL